MMQIWVFNLLSCLGEFCFMLLFTKMYLVTFCSTHSPREVSGDSIEFFVCLFVVVIKNSWGSALIICQAWHV